MSTLEKFQNDLELLTLKGLLEDDCKCESAHAGENKLCSGDVVARKRSSCGSDFLICTNSFRWNMAFITSGYKACSGCGDLASECWTITPI